MTGGGREPFPASGGPFLIYLFLTAGLQYQLFIPFSFTGLRVYPGDVIAVGLALGLAVAWNRFGQVPAWVVVNHDAKAAPCAE